MSAFTTTLENNVLDHVLANTAYTQPTAVYGALFTTATDDTGGGTEVSAGGYARVQIEMDAASGGSASNTNDETFGPATANWGTVSHFALYDAATAGNMLIHGALSASKTIETNDELKFAAGTGITISLD